jgi:hypothetical protein
MWALLPRFRVHLLVSLLLPVKMGSPGSGGARLLLPGCDRAVRPLPSKMDVPREDVGAG